MRALILLLALIPSVAAAQSPPSKTLERAIKLYDKQDYFSATIELKKVLEGHSGDTPENLARAQFFLAKSMYQIQFHAASLAMLQRIILEDSHPYRTASWKWVAALRNVIPDAMLVSSVDQMTDQDLDDPALQSVRQDLVAIRAAKNPPPFDPRQVARDAMGCTHPEPARMREVVQKLRGYEDNFEVVQAVRVLLRTNDVYAQTIDLAMQRTPPVRDARRWVGELETELELLQTSDRAWQTTNIAAEILQEVTVQHSVGEADLGKHLRVMLDAMEPEIAMVGSYTAPPDRCSRGGGATTLAGTPAPMVVRPKQTGCGCSTGGSPDGGLLVVLLAVAFRRKSRAASGTRSLRA